MNIIQVDNRNLQLFVILCAYCIPRSVFRGVISIYMGPQNLGLKKNRIVAETLYQDYV